MDYKITLSFISAVFILGGIYLLIKFFKGYSLEANSRIVKSKNGSRIWLLIYSIIAIFIGLLGVSFFNFSLFWFLLSRF